MTDDKLNTQTSELKKRIVELENLLLQSEEKTEASNHLKSVFLSNISHEIRTPMNGIIGMYNVLKQTELTEEQCEYLDIINLSGHNLLAIIDDILDLSRIETGQLSLEKKEFLLTDEIKYIYKLLDIKAKGKGIRLVTSIDKRIPDELFGDYIRLKQIIINLSNNAIKYTKEGSVTIQLDLISSKSNSCKIKFSIIDTGIGISEENKMKLFKAFSQIDSSTTRKYGGTGLGLAIAKNLCALMNGEIGVESEVGKGSIFWFTAEIDFSKNLISNLKQKANVLTEKQRPLNILLVEDNLLNQKFAVATLKKEGHSIKIAENGKIAVDLFKQNNYDLILMDIQMPVMDGIDATISIREYEKKYNKKFVKIVAITAYVVENDRNLCIDSGMNEYIAKPYKPKELVSIICDLKI